MKWMVPFQEKKRPSGFVILSAAKDLCPTRDPSLRSELALEPFATAQGKLREGMTKPDGLLFEMYWSQGVRIGSYRGCFLLQIGKVLHDKLTEGACCLREIMLFMQKEMIGMALPQTAAQENLTLFVLLFPVYFFKQVFCRNAQSGCNLIYR